MKKSLSLVARTLGAGLVLGMAGSAHAHIDMLAPLLGRQGDQKADPCEGKPRGPVYTFEPGAVITLGVNEAVKHDSYFRIAFDNDGQDGFKNPASIDPINPQRLAGAGLTPAPARPGFPKCMAADTDKCGASDFCNVVSKTGGASVLWDNLDPHLSMNKTEWKWTIQLPNVECENCTIQVIQVMEDIAFGAHGPFDNKSDLYYRCIDIKLKKGAGTAGPGNATGPVSANGIDCTKAEMTDAGVMLPDSGVIVYNDAGVTPGAGADAGTTSSDAGVVSGQLDASSQVPGSDSSIPGVTGGGTTGGQSPAANDDGGCSVHLGAKRGDASLAGFALLALGLLASRRSRARNKRS